MWVFWCVVCNKLWIVWTERAHTVSSSQSNEPKASLPTCRTPHLIFLSFIFATYYRLHLTNRRTLRPLTCEHPSGLQENVSSSPTGNKKSKWGHAASSEDSCGGTEINATKLHAASEHTVCLLKEQFVYLLKLRHSELTHILKCKSFDTLAIFVHMLYSSAAPSPPLVPTKAFN